MISRLSQWFLQWCFIFGLLALVLTCLVLTGCVSGGALMKRPVTGETVECGRYVWASPSLLSLTLESRERECINGFRLQGYERVPDRSSV